MRRDKEIEKLIAQVRYRSHTSVRARIRAHLDDLWQRRRPVTTDRRTRHLFGRSTMTRWSQAAVIALALAALAGLIGLLSQSAGPVYALEQTIAAVREIRYFHLQFFRGFDMPSREAWIEYDPNGVLRHVRVDFCDINHVAVWSDNVNQYWRRDSNELWIYEDEEYTDKILYFVQRYDPRQAITYLQERSREGGIQVDIEQSAGGTDPVTVTVNYDPNTFLIGRPMPPMRERFLIDPGTKLIARVESEALLKGQYISTGDWNCVDYNRPFDPSIFDLKSEVPPDVNVSDTTGIFMGLEQGELTDEEVAVELVRQFLDAWAAQDYDRAIQLHGYTVLGETKGIREKLLSSKNILRVISVGPAVVPERPMRGLLVPCVVEYEEDGQMKSGPLEFNASEAAPGRWRIRGPQTMK